MAVCRDSAREVDANPERLATESRHPGRLGPSLNTIAADVGLSRTNSEPGHPAPSFLESCEQEEAGGAGEATHQEAQAEGAGTGGAIGSSLSVRPARTPAPGVRPAGAPACRGAVAQVVERATHNRVVAGSSPAGTTMLPTDRSEPLLLGLQQSGLIRSGDRVLVAVSGGPDSSALLVAAREQGHDVVAAHYDHALQGGSAAAAQHVADLCDQLSVELVMERRRCAMPRGSVQAAARA